MELICALCALRELGVIHRDIKPANVMIDADGRAILSDIGTSAPTSTRRRDITLHLACALTGLRLVATLGYRTNADVRSLGRVFLEILRVLPWPILRYAGRG
ncbi:kinase-like domain-containing protein [Daedaleopsis nitida]|nr:kinase-like domain-containing protein [Daedaleopsis nitida]